MSPRSMIHFGRCRRYLLGFEVNGLDKEDPSRHVDRDSGKPVDWDEFVRHRLAFVGRKYGYDNVTAVVHGVEYKVVVE